MILSFMRGDRTCNGGAYTFQIPGALAIAENVLIPMRVQGAASIRCIYAYVKMPTTDGQSAYLVKVSRDDGATWQPLEYMGIAQKLPGGFKNTYDFLVENEGYGLPATRRLSYNDFGTVIIDAITAGPGQQTVHTASYGANRLGFDVGEFVHISLGEADEEYKCSRPIPRTTVHGSVHQGPLGWRQGPSDHLANGDSQRGR